MGFPPVRPRSFKWWLAPASLEKSSVAHRKAHNSAHVDILYDNTALWSYEWNYEEKCLDSYAVYYDQGDKSKISSSSIFMLFLS